MATEIQRLRKEQAKAVMPLIGPLLDEWEGLPNDIRGLRELYAFSKHIEALYRAMGIE